MKEIKEDSVFAAICRRKAVWKFLFLALLATGTLSGCRIKKNIPVTIPPAILQAKSASLEELLGILRSYEKVEGLSSSGISLTYTSARNKEKGVLEKYQSIRGHILLKRPDSVRLLIELPITHSRLADVLSVGDNFSVRTNDSKFYKGKNSARNLGVPEGSGSKEFSIGIRGPHIFEAVFPQASRLDEPGTWLNLEQIEDSRTSYYVLSQLTEAKKHPDKVHILHTIRKIWIERSGLTIARQQVFGEGGRVVSDITYSEPVQIQGVYLPLKMHIDRPVDGYILDLTFKSWNVNPEMEKEAFELDPLAGDQVIELKEKGTE